MNKGRGIFLKTTPVKKQYIAIFWHIYVIFLKFNQNLALKTFKIGQSRQKLANFGPFFDFFPTEPVLAVLPKKTAFHEIRTPSRNP